MTLLTPGFFRLKKFDEKSAPKVASASRYGRVGAARLRGIGLAARFAAVPAGWPWGSVGGVARWPRRARRHLHVGGTSAAVSYTHLTLPTIYSV